MTDEQYSPTLLPCPNCHKPMLWVHGTFCYGNECSIDACPHCYYLQAVDATFEFFGDRVLMWQEVKKKYGVRKFSQLKYIEEVHSDEDSTKHLNGAVGALTKANFKLTGIPLNSASEYKEFYYAFYPSARSNNKSEMNRLQLSLRIGSDTVDHHPNTNMFLFLLVNNWRFYQANIALVHNLPNNVQEMLLQEAFPF